jgi:hypothetical protein
MRVFAVRIEHPFDVSVQCPQHTNAGMHQKVVAFRGADQATDRGLPLVELLIGLRKLGNVVACVGGGGAGDNFAAGCSSRRCPGQQFLLKLKGRLHKRIERILSAIIIYPGIVGDVTRLRREKVRTTAGCIRS